MPATLVFGSVGDHTDAVPSWFGNNGEREHSVAIVYYGKNSDSPWTRSIRRSADYYSEHKGGKFPNLLWWLDNHPHALDQFDYVLVTDDDIRLTPAMVGRMVRTAREHDLPVSSPSHRWDGRVSYWGHMMARGGGKRIAEPTAGIELCNFVEMTCVLFRTDALRAFLDLFRRYADRLAGHGTDWLIACACYTDRHPFGVMHNVSIVNSRSRPGLPVGHREIDQLQSSPDRARAWRDIVAADRLPLTGSDDLRVWRPQPRMRCINLDRAIERREKFACDWIEGLGFPIRFFSAVDRRDIDAGRLTLPYDDGAARRRINRPMTTGEIACAASHVLLMYEEMEFCGPEGVFIMEDDCYPIPGAGADKLVDRVAAAVAALPGIEAVACHKPHVRYTIREAAGGAIRLLNPPWGSIVTWYSPSGLCRAWDLLSRMECPADWIWRDLAALGKFAMLDPPVALHEVSDTTYIGNEYRGIHRRFIP